MACLLLLKAISQNILYFEMDFKTVISLIDCGAILYILEQYGM